MERWPERMEVCESSSVGETVGLTWPLNRNFFPGLPRLKAIPNQDLGVLPQKKGHQTGRQKPATYGKQRDKQATQKPSKRGRQAMRKAGRLMLISRCDLDSSGGSSTGMLASLGGWHIVIPARNTTHSMADIVSPSEQRARGQHTGRVLWCSAYANFAVKGFETTPRRGQPQ